MKYGLHLYKLQIQIIDTIKELLHSLQVRYCDTFRSLSSIEISHASSKSNSYNIPFQSDVTTADDNTEVTENYTEEDASGAVALDSMEVTESEVENDISDHDSGSSAGSLFPLSQTSESSSISTPSFLDFTDSSSIQSEANISPMFSPQMSTYK